eukprot:TRINITY_DN70658_c0_g1_i1.p1 TRINITY_DN70658_c0_g1~~TRINITY_DN70658_c0_g1_i1.p1  ORF type:complete len:470 (-),score=55.14 TRINITY_DN70658_c0_g1_i1:21-1430(-)
MVPMAVRLLGLRRDWNAQDLTTSYFYNARGFKDCFLDQQSRNSCCADPAEKAGCFSPDPPITRVLCCSDFSRVDEPDTPQLHVYRSLADAAYGHTYVRVLPHKDRSFCVVQESGRLLELSVKLRSCLKADLRRDAQVTGALARKCMDAHLAQSLRFWMEQSSLSESSPPLFPEASVWVRQARRNYTMLPWREVSGGCWPSNLGHDKGWPDFLRVLSLTIQRPVGDLLQALDSSVQALNYAIYEVNNLVAKPWAAATFRPAAAPLAYPEAGMRPLEEVLRPHRGDVLVRLLTEVDLALRRPVGEGLVYVEVGVAYGYLARWIATKASGIVRRMHLVDTFQEYDSMQALVNTLTDIGLEECSASMEKFPYPSRRFCGPKGFQATIHHVESETAARLSEDVDFVFVDAGHDYKSVMTDLESWWPRIRPGGVMGGHDFEYEQNIGGGEVGKAVSVFFDSDVFLDSETVWWVPK